MAVVEAEVALVDRPDVVADRAVVAVAQVVVPQAGREVDGGRDFVWGVPQVDEPHGLVVQPPVEITLAGQVALDRLTSPVGPSVTGKHHVGHSAPTVQGLIDVAAPHEGIANEGSSQGEHVVHGARAVLGHTEGSVLGKIEVHFGWCLGFRSELELHPDSVQHQFLTGFGDLDGRRDQR